MWVCDGGWTWSSLALHFARWLPSNPPEVPVLSPEVRTVLDAVSLDAPWSLVERFSTLEREHPRDVEAAANEIRGRLESFGAPVEVHEPDLYLSLPGRATVAVGSGEFSAKPMAMSRPTQGLTAPLLHLPNTRQPALDEIFARP